VSASRLHRHLDSLGSSLAVAALLAACGPGPGSTPKLDVRPQSAAAGPQVVAVDPPNGATGVDPTRTTLAATFDREMDRMRSQAWFTRLAPAARIAVRCSTTTSLHAACEAGAGVALLTTSAVRGNPRFVNVLPRLEAPPSEMWLVTHADLRASARVAAALRFLEELVRRTEGPP